MLSLQWIDVLDTEIKDEFSCARLTCIKFSGICCFNRDNVRKRANVCIAQIPLGQVRIYDSHNSPSSLLSRVGTHLVLHHLPNDLSLVRKGRNLTCFLFIEQESRTQTTTHRYARRRRPPYRVRLLDTQCNKVLQQMATVHH